MHLHTYNRQTCTVETIKHVGHKLRSSKWIVHGMQRSNAYISSRKMRCSLECLASCIQLLNHAVYLSLPNLQTITRPIALACRLAKAGRVQYGELEHALQQPNMHVAALLQMACMVVLALLTLQILKAKPRITEYRAF